MKKLLFTAIVTAAIYYFLSPLLAFVALACILTTWSMINDSRR